MSKKNKLIHVLPNSIYSKRFCDIILVDHLEKNDYLQIKIHEKSLSKGQKAERGEFFSKKGWILFKYLIFLNRKDRIIFHSFTNPRHYIMLLFFPWHLDKIVWIMWGGDIYSYPFFENKSSFRYILLESIRKFLIKRLKYCATFLPTDFDFVVNYYKCKAKYIQILYPSDINEVEIEDGNLIANSKSNNEALNFFLGNSADDSNRHLEALERLYKIYDKISTISVPLMYGGSEDYISNIVKRGKELFGAKFIPILKYIPSEDYRRIIDKTDVLVFNHLRQQGLGNLFYFILVEKQIFINSCTSTYFDFKKWGIDLVKFEQLDEDNFRLLSTEILKQNKIRIKELTSNRKIKNMWFIFFESIK